MSPRWIAALKRLIGFHDRAVIFAFAGLALLAFSQFETAAMLGLATSLTLIVALAFDLFVLLALLTLARALPGDFV